MITPTSKIRFDKSGFYFIGLMGIVLLGFWPSYFSKFLNGTENHSFYFHFHVVMMSLWLFALISQPILIRRKKLAVHKFMGRLTYILMPMLFISVILLTHYRIHDHIRIVNNQKLYGPHLLVPFKDLIILGTAYIIAIVYRHEINIHARAMVATGIVFIEPALVRFLVHSMNDAHLAYYLTIGFVYSILIGLMILEWKQKRGRWVFPLILGLYIVVHSLLIFHINFSIWETFAIWFAGLPLT